MRRQRTPPRGSNLYTKHIDMSHLAFGRSILFSQSAVQVQCITRGAGSKIVQNATIRVAVRPDVIYDHHQSIRARPASPHLSPLEIVEEHADVSGVSVSDQPSDKDSLSKEIRVGTCRQLVSPRTAQDSPSA